MDRRQFMLSGLASLALAFSPNSSAQEESEDDHRVTTRYNPKTEILTMKDFPLPKCSSTLHMYND